MLAVNAHLMLAVNAHLMLAVNAHLMLAVNAHLTLAVIPILYIGSAKVQQNSNFTKRKSDFFSSPLTLFLLYSFFIPSLFPTAEQQSISSGRKSPRSDHRRRCGSR